LSFTNNVDLLNHPKKGTQKIHLSMKGLEK
jgi:hypothetical protein